MIIFMNTTAIILAACAMFSLFLSIKNYLEKIQPIIVFCVENTGNGEIWYIKNVGSGPALNVYVTGGNETGWNPLESVLIPAIEPGEGYLMKWVLTKGALIAKYSNISSYFFFRRIYTSICRKNKNKFYKRNKFRYLKKEERALFSLNSNEYSKIK